MGQWIYKAIQQIGQLISIINKMFNLKKSFCKYNYFMKKKLIFLIYKFNIL